MKLKLSFPFGWLNAATVLALAVNLHAATLYVDANSANPVSPYTNWATAARLIHNAVDAAVSGDTVLVTNGVYPGGLTVSKPLSLLSINGPQFTVINGGGTNRCVSLTNIASLSGFTLTNGFAPSGGGVWFSSASANLTNCILSGNSCSAYGGGAYGGTLYDCTLSGNSAPSGGGAYNAVLNRCILSSNFALKTVAVIPWSGDGGGACLGTLNNCILSGNSAQEDGGGAYFANLNSCSLIENSSARHGGGAAGCGIRNCVVNRNSAAADGGGVSGGLAFNCILTANSAQQDGAGVSYGLLYNCLVVANSASQYAGGAFNSNLRNCIVYYNTATGGDPNYRGGSWEHSCTSPLPLSGSGNITNEPRFVSLATGDFHLQPDSPCINAGTNVFVLSDTDLDGNPRIINCTVDLGAYEFQQPSPPCISPQPLSQNVYSGTEVTFTAGAWGIPPFTWQWWFNNASIPTATNATLTLPGVTTNQTGRYFVTVSNAFASVTSQVASLTVTNQEPLITLQPVNWMVDVGSDLTLTTTAEGSLPMTWQWRFNGSALPDATNSSLRLPAITISQVGSYSVVVSNAFGSETGQVATVSFGEPELTLQPVSQVKYVGSSVTFSAAVVGRWPFFWQWRFKKEAIPNATNSILTLPAVTPDSAGAYSVIVSNAAGSIVSDEATLTVFSSRSPISYVWQDSPDPAPPYDSWTTAAHVIQDAVEATESGGTVLVTNGTYATGGRQVGTSGSANRVAVDRPLTLRSINGPAVTVIQGLKVAVPYGAEAIRCVYLVEGAMLNGFTLTNGANYYDDGGGIYSVSTNVTVTNCVLSGNSGRYGGGVANCTLYNCTLSGNKTGGFGGGAAYSTLHYCNLIGNYATNGGGAYSSTLYNCTLTQNEGGGASGSTLYNCSLTGNSAGWGTGGAYSCALYNCTLTGNAGGAYSSKLYNCIAYFNTGENYSPGYSDGYGVSTFTYCCTTPMPTNGVGNITNEPGFISVAGGNFRLQANSPCIHAGNNAFVSTTTDLDCRPRLVGGTVDMGAYEYQGPGMSGFIGWLQQCGLPTDGSVDNADPDGDGRNNWQEWKAGTIPTNSLSVLRMLSAVTNSSGLSVSWQSVTDRTYFLERATNFSSLPAFFLLRGDLPGQAGTTTFTDTNAIGPGPFFYRVGVQE